MAKLNFNANEVEPSQSFEALPAGKYLAIIAESEMKQTSGGNGQYLKLKFQVIEGEHKNRVVFAQLNPINQNPTAVRIAQGELSAICRAVGVMTPDDSVELHDKPLVISLKIRKRGDTGEMQNEIKGYERKEVAVSQPQQANGNPVWARS